MRDLLCVSVVCFWEVGIARNWGTSFITPSRLESPEKGQPKRAPPLFFGNPQVPRCFCK